MDVETEYTDPSKPGSYTGVRKFTRELKKRGHNVKQKNVEKVLQGVDSYTLYKTVRKTFPTRPVLVSGVDDLWDIDLIELSEDMVKGNGGVRFLLVVIDVLSRYAWAVPLKSKSSQAVLKGFQQILGQESPYLGHRSPYKLRSDSGLEFLNKAFLKFLKENGIQHFVNMNYPKANYIEIFNKTIQRKIHRHMQKTNSWEFVSVLPDIMKSYNETYHRSIKMAPSEVTYENEKQLYLAQYDRKKKKEQKYKFQLNDQIRISKFKHKFHRSYQEQFTGEIFWIHKRFKRQGFNVYELRDCSDSVIKGRFYEIELTKVNKQGDDLWEIEKIIKRRGRGKNAEVLVRWKYYPKECASWIPASELKDV